MQADLERFFENEVAEPVSDHICAVIISLWERVNELENEKTVNDRIHTEMAIRFQQKSDAYDQLLEKYNDVQKQLACALDTVALKNKAIFGSHTEKMLGLIEGSADKHAIPEDEAQEEQEETAESTGNSKTSVFPEPADQREKKEKVSSAVEKKKRTRRLKSSLDSLPQEYEFLLDTDKLNQEYGEHNWRITGWHAHQTLEKLPVSYYTRTVYTPVISHGLEHSLATIPYCNSLVDKSYLSASFAADMLYRKFCLSLPFHRQSADYCNQGIDLSRQVMIRWANRIVTDVLTPVYNHMIACLMKQGYIHSDETIIHVNRDERTAGRKNYMWIHCSSELLDCSPIIIFSYEATRNTDHLRNMFGEFLGYMTCDAYVSYQVFESENDGVQTTGCWMHCRRYWANAFFLNDITRLSEDILLELPETRALFLIRDIYIEERKLKDLTAEERLEHRQTDVKPAVDAFFAYIHELHDSGKVFSDRVLKAITYAVNQEKYLRRFLEDGRIPCDNGQAERHIRSYSVGRANWLFADTVTGAQVNAIAYSVTETAKANHVNVELYLRYLFEQVPSYHDSFAAGVLDSLMPWSDTYRQYEKRLKDQNLAMYQSLFPVPEAPRTPRKRDWRTVDHEINSLSECRQTAV